MPTARCHAALCCTVLVVLCTEMKAALDVTTSGYMALTEGVFSSALPMAALYLLGLSTGNWWYTLAGADQFRRTQSLSSTQQLAVGHHACMYRLCWSAEPRQMPCACPKQATQDAAQALVVMLLIACTCPCTPFASCRYLALFQHSDPGPLWC